MTFPAATGEYFTYITQCVPLNQLSLIALLILTIGYLVIVVLFDLLVILHLLVLHLALLCTFLDLYVLVSIARLRLSLRAVLRFYVYYRFICLT